MGTSGSECESHYGRATWIADRGEARERLEGSRRGETKDHRIVSDEGIGLFLHGAHATAGRLSATKRELRGGNAPAHPATRPHGSSVVLVRARGPRRDEREGALSRR